MTLARIGMSIFGWLAAVTLMLNACVLGLWAPASRRPGLLVGAFLFLAGAFAAAGVAALFGRRFARHPETTPRTGWIVAGSLAAALIVAVVLTMTVTVKVLMG